MNRLVPPALPGPVHEPSVPRPLAGAARVAAEPGVGLHVVCARQQVWRLFRITGLDHSIPLARTLAEALQIMAAGAAAQTKADIQWSPRDPDLLREALAALRQLA